jgi:hypothetical protein
MADEAEIRDARAAAAASRSEPPRLTPVVAGVLAATFGVTVAGGYGFGWTWTGYGDNPTAWAWLQLLILPVVITLLPVWARTRERYGIEWRLFVFAAAAAWLILMAGTYALDWGWTGFRGRTEWDWLELLVLPVTLALLPIVLTQRRRDRRVRLVLAAVAIAFVASAAGGYLLDWGWTGFPGNTLWDWLHLFLVPFVVPAALIWLNTVERREPEPAA